MIARRPKAASAGTAASSQKPVVSKITSARREDPFHLCRQFGRLAQQQRGDALRFQRLALLLAPHRADRFGPKALASASAADRAVGADYQEPGTGRPGCVAGASQAVL